jgi:hypothetical protein
MLRKALVLGLLSIADVTGTSVVGAAGEYFAQEPPSIAGAPFSAVVKTESNTPFADGNRIVRTNLVRFFRDAQGRTRTERGRAPDTVITINDPVSAVRYVLRARNKTFIAYKMPTAAGMVPAQRGSVVDDLAPFALLGFGMGIGATPTTEASVETTSLGQMTINGLTATGTRLVRTIPSGVLGNEKPITSTLDRWLSSDLRIPVQISQKSSLGGELTLTLTHVERREPDAALFVPPPDYSGREINLPSLPAANEAQ